MLTVYVNGIGIWGPGLEGWPAASAVLAGRAGYGAAAPGLPAIDLLPPAERRRISPTIRLALAVAQEAVTQSGADPKTLASIFASSGGDGDTIHNILETLATPARDVSPTKFHNSVHNAPSGYWALAVACREPSTTLCAHDWSFAAGLLEAATQAAVDQRAMLLVAYDKAYPEPLNTARPIRDLFGTALVLASAPGPHSLAKIEMEFAGGDAPESGIGDEALERLRRGNPAARSLPLLAAVARAAPQTLILENAPSMRLSLAVTPRGGA